MPVCFEMRGTEMSTWCEIVVCGTIVRAVLDLSQGKTRIRESNGLEQRAGRSEMLTLRVDKRCFTKGGLLHNAIPSTAF